LPHPELRVGGIADELKQAGSHWRGEVVKTLWAASWKSACDATVR
jgi:hypothetical protein